MKRIGVRELRQNASKFLRRVASGETIEITDRGRPVAHLVPVQGSPVERLIRQGRLRPAGSSLDDLGPALRPRVGEKLPSLILRELRKDER